LPDNLPLELSSFVDREREVAEVRRLLGDNRLLTLTGPGGCGKTRLALAVASEVAGDVEDGAWWVGLAPLSDQNLISQAIAQALKVREQPGFSLTETLADSLREKRLLLVLDNCEHLIEACARFAHTMLSSCRRLRILATSRETLGVAGEADWRVPSLTVPEVDHPPSVEDAAHYEAIRLFVERARSKLSSFSLTLENARAVAEVCRKLDGIPLAIELAAARVPMLSVERISERLENPLELLSAGDRTAEPRQRTLRATLQWSHELLSEPEQVLFRRLSVFAGGWTLDAAEAVCAGEGIEREEVLNLLSRLGDKSLVVAGAGGPKGALRYRMLEPVRQYARELLEESGEAGRLREQHAGHYLALAEEAQPELKGAKQGEWLGRLEREHGNLRTALGWSVDGGVCRTRIALGGGARAVLVGTRIPERGARMAGEGSRRKWRVAGVSAGEGAERGRLVGALARRPRAGGGAARRRLGFFQRAGRRAGHRHYAGQPGAYGAAPGR
jgi:non-specific serine/threonine protein kinase